MLCKQHCHSSAARAGRRADGGYGAAPLPLLARVAAAHARRHARLVERRGRRVLPPAARPARRRRDRGTTPARDCGAARSARRTIAIAIAAARSLARRRRTERERTPRPRPPPPRRPTSGWQKNLTAETCEDTRSTGLHATRMPRECVVDGTSMIPLALARSKSRLSRPIVTVVAVFPHSPLHSRVIFDAAAAARVVRVALAGVRFAAAGLAAFRFAAAGKPNHPSR